MSRERLLIIGIVILLLGIQFRRVETFVFNKPASAFIEKKITSKLRKDSVTSYTAYSDWSGTDVAMKSVEPPVWIGWSLVSVGAVMVLTSPCYRK